MNERNFVAQELHNVEFSSGDIKLWKEVDIEIPVAHSVFASTLLI